MSVLAIVVLIVAGYAAGFLADYFDSPAGVLLVPLLLASYAYAEVSSLVATPAAWGTGLLVAGSIAGVRAVRLQKATAWPATIVLAMGATAAAIACLAAGLTRALPVQVLHRLLGCIVAVAVVQSFLEQKHTKKREAPAGGEVRAALGGVVVGSVSSATGVAGGLSAVPLLYTHLGFSYPRAQAMGEVVTALAAVGGVAGCIVWGMNDSLLPSGMIGYLDPVRAFVLALGAVPGSYMGAKTSHRRSQGTPRRVFELLLIVIAVRLLVAP